MQAQIFSAPMGSAHWQNGSMTTYSSEFFSNIYPNTTVNVPNDTPISQHKEGQRQDGGRLWYCDTTFSDGTVNEHVENCQFPCLDLSTHTPRSIEDQQYSYNFDDIDQLSDALRITWECSKDMPFVPSTKYIGLQWDLQHLTVSLTIQKKAKYIANINEWLLQPTHIINNVQKLYGRLLHASLVIPSGHAHLTGLEAMLGLCNQCPFVPYSPVKGITDDLHWWLSRLNQPSVSRPIPAPHVVTDPNAFSDASSGVGCYDFNQFRLYSHDRIQSVSDNAQAFVQGAS